MQDSSEQSLSVLSRLVCEASHRLATHLTQHSSMDSSPPDPAAQPPAWVDSDGKYWLLKEQQHAATIDECMPLVEPGVTPSLHGQAAAGSAATASPCGVAGSGAQQPAVEQQHGWTIKSNAEYIIECSCLMGHAGQLCLEDCVWLVVAVMLCWGFFLFGYIWGSDPMYPDLV
jgi:hypothetical protein